MDLEVSLYIRNLKNFLEINEEERNLLLGSSMDLIEFLEKVEEFAIQNVKDGKQPALTREQFDKIRGEYITLVGEAPIFIFSDDYPPLFLN